MIAILSALWDEIEKLTKELHPAEEGRAKDVRYKLGSLYGRRVLLGQTGVGIKRARTGVSYIIQKYKPGIIIYAGLGGALSPELRVGDIVVGESIISLMKGEKRELFTDFPDVGNECRKADILTENRFINDPEAKRRLYEESGAMVVDMETWGVLEASLQSRTPVVSVRSVSDEAWELLPDMGAIYNDAGKFDLGKSLPYFLSNPAHISPYIRFRFRSYKRAVVSLNNFLALLLRELDESASGADV